MKELVSGGSEDPAALAGKYAQEQNLQRAEFLMRFVPPGADSRAMVEYLGGRMDTVRFFIRKYPIAFNHGSLDIIRQNLEYACTDEENIRDLFYRAEDVSGQQIERQSKVFQASQTIPDLLLADEIGRLRKIALIMRANGKDPARLLREVVVDFVASDYIRDNRPIPPPLKFALGRKGLGQRPSQINPELEDRLLDLIRRMDKNRINTMTSQGIDPRMAQRMLHAETETRETAQNSPEAREEAARYEWMKEERYQDLEQEMTTLFRNLDQAVAALLNSRAGESLI